MMHSLNEASKACAPTSTDELNAQSWSRPEPSKSFYAVITLKDGGDSNVVFFITSFLGSQVATSYVKLSPSILRD